MSDKSQGQELDLHREDSKTVLSQPTGRKAGTRIVLKQLPRGRVLCETFLVLVSDSDNLHTDSFI